MWNWVNKKKWLICHKWLAHVMAFNWFLALGRGDNLDTFSISYTLLDSQIQYMWLGCLQGSKKSLMRDILGLPFYCASSRAHLLEEALKCFFCASLCVTIFMAQRRKKTLYICDSNFQVLEFICLGVHLPRLVV